MLGDLATTLEITNMGLEICEDNLSQSSACCRNGRECSPRQRSEEATGGKDSPGKTSEGEYSGGAASEGFTS